MSYFEDKRINASMLKCFAGDHYSQRQAVHRWKNFTPTKAVNLGSAVHHGIEHIGREVLLEEYADFFKETLKTEKSRLENAAIVPKIVAAFKDQLPDLVDEIKAKPIQVEAEFYTDDKKAKIDFVGEACIWDWKTTSDVSYWGIKNRIRDLHYDLQAAHYLEVTGYEAFNFAFIQTAEPFEIVIVPASEAMIESGKQKAEIAQARLESYLIGETQDVRTYIYD